jgi:GMP synthase (glutamine-hydrolysing)
LPANEFSGVALIARILIVQSAPAASQAAFAKHGGVDFAENYAQALRSQAGGVFDAVECVVVRAGDCEDLPRGLSLTDFDGIAWTGSPLNAYDTDPVTRHQIAFARAGYDSGVPGFGSCWGMQAMSVALGGRVHRHPGGSEYGVARQIRLNEAGRGHPMFAGKPAVFDALCWHEDEVSAAPPGAVALAANEHSGVQAMACEDGERSFWGVQYHPEFDLGQVAALLSGRARRMAADGFVRNESEAVQMAEDLRSLQAAPRRDVAWRYGIGADVTDARRHRAELANWLRAKVAPRAARRG